MKAFKRLLTGLAVVAIVVMAQAVLPRKAVAGDGLWAQVCCGSLCTGGQPYCIGVGTFTCCR